MRSVSRIQPCVFVACVLAAVDLAAQTPQKTVVLHPVDTHDVLFVLVGGGENALALALDDGVVLIDPLPWGWGDATLKAIHSVSDQPVNLFPSKSVPVV